MSFETFESKVETAITEAKALVTNNPTTAAAMAVLKASIKHIATIASQAAVAIVAAGEAKKALVEQKVGLGFDALWASFPVPLYLLPFKSTIGIYVKQYALATIDADIEAIYQTVVIPTLTPVTLLAPAQVVAHVEGAGT